MLVAFVFSRFFFLVPQRCRISHRRQCAALLHWNLAIPPSLWPDRDYGSIIVPVWLWQHRRLQSGICFCETAIAPMGFMACSRRLDQTGMYLKNEYSVFKEHQPHFLGCKKSIADCEKDFYGLSDRIFCLKDRIPKEKFSFIKWMLKKS